MSKILFFIWCSFWFTRIYFFVFFINDFKSAPLALLAKKVIVRGWMVYLVFSVTFQCHFEKCYRTDFSWRFIFLRCSCLNTKRSSCLSRLVSFSYFKHDNENVIIAAIQIDLRLLINSLV